jgi:hypothetical protein
MIQGKELTDATLAMLQWLQSQDIAVEDAPVVLANAIVTIVHSIALDRGSNPQEGLKLLSRDMKRRIAELP